nr:MAG TPA: hypothetical protein [Caudoviricetes sp.]
MKNFDIQDWAELSYVKYKRRRPFDRYKWEYEEEIDINDFDIDEFLYEVEEWQVNME